MILVVAARKMNAFKASIIALLAPDQPRRRILSRQELRQKLYLELELPSRHHRQQVEEYRRRMSHRWPPSEAEIRATIDEVIKQRRREKGKV